MIKKKIAINASNLHSGGGVQVAASFISDILTNHELTKDILKSYSITIFISDKVGKCLQKKIEFFDGISIIKKNSYGIRSIFSNTLTFKSFDKVFTIFGPLYIFHKRYDHICGFAQPWIAFPESKFIKSLTLHEKFLKKLKLSLQKLFFFKFSDVLVVETDAVRSCLIKNYNFNNIYVVPNSLNSFFYGLNDKKITKSYDDTINVCYVSRGYPHKNHLFIIKLAEFLKKNALNHSRSFRFHITLSDQELRNLNISCVESVINHGEIELKQLPKFYNAMDASIFPSKLECFSAFPIESMHFMNHLFVSDEPFNKYLPEDSVTFIDTNNVEETANKILIHDYNDSRGLIQSKKFVQSLPTSIDRTKNYLDIVMD